MKKFHKNALYHPDDKDVLDFLDSKEVSYNTLSKYLRRRRIYTSKDDPIDATREYVSMLPLDWEATCNLIDLVNIPTTIEKETSSTMSAATEVEKIEKAAATVKNNRSDSKRESYRITRNAKGKLEVEVSYVEADASQTRLIQKRDKKLTIKIETDNGEIRFRHENNERAAGIVQSIQGQIIESLEVEEPPLIRDISLENLTTAELRVKFFMSMMKDLDGLELRDITDIKVERMPKLIDPGGENVYTDSEEDSDIDHDSAENSIKRLIIKGNNLNLTPEFNQIISKGYFISHATWQSETTDGKSEYIEFDAGFKNAEIGRGFQYRIIGKYKRDDDGEISKTRERLTEVDSSQYKRILEKCAEKTIDSIKA